MTATLHDMKTFNGEKVQLDDGIFDTCTFEGCTIIYCGGTLPLMRSCTFNNCQFVLDEAAGNTLIYLAHLHKFGNGGATIVEGMFDMIRRGEFHATIDTYPGNTTLN